MLDEKLELVIITYNRDNYLENTLSQLIKSPFATCKLTILDNSSTDKTPEICLKYQKLFTNMEIIRHPTNIGGSANFLRAVETSKSLYTWILGDDDDYDFSDCDDLIEAIDSENFDILLLYSSNFLNSEGKNVNEILEDRKLVEKADFKITENRTKEKYYSCYETSGEELFKLIKRYYFFIMGFIPSVIFRTDTYDSECLIEGYNNIHNLYPHYKFICKSIENDNSIYKSKKDIIIRYTENTISYSLLNWFIGWFESSLMIKSPSDRKIVTERYFKSSFSQILIYSVIRDKACGGKNFKNEIISLMGTLIKVKGIFKGIIYSILVLFLSFIPQKLCKILKKKMESIRSSMETES